MVETICPVVHGTRTWLISVALFAAAATGSAALLGLGLGAVLPQGGASAAAAVAAFALLAALSELGLLRLPLPQLRRQVPERWRERYPQPLVALLYGAGLGVGFATYVPFATLFVVAAAVVTLAGPAGGAMVLAAFGAGRGLALAVATARVTSYEQAACRVELMVRIGGRSRLRRGNALALVGLAAVLALGAATGTAQAATRIDLGNRPVADPSAGDGVFAFDRINPDGSLTGVVRIAGVFTNLPGYTPDVDGSNVVVDTGPAFEIVDTTTMTVTQTLPLKGRDPALSGSWLVYRHTGPSRRQIVLYDLSGGTSKVIASSRLGTDLGAPDISGSRVVYHRTSGSRSAVMLYRIKRADTVSLRSTVRYSYSDPSIDGRNVFYVSQTLFGMQLNTLDVVTHTNHQVFSIRKGSGRFLWTTAIRGQRRYFTVYTDSDSWIDRL